MANNVETFDLDAFIARQVCAWPGCVDKGLLAVGRCFDGKRIYHCPHHHCLVIGHKQTYSVIQDREIELSRWQEEGGSNER